LSSSRPEERDDERSTSEMSLLIERSAVPAHAASIPGPVLVWPAKVNMNRREALLTTGAMTMAASLGAIACAAENAVAQGTSAPAVAGVEGLADAAFDCQKKGQACADHCVRMLSTGDPSMGECLMAVREMLPVTATLGELASMSSKHLPAAARLALEVCESCEAACRKHAQAHAVCRDCADTCARTVVACRKAGA
jgi:Cys-rich four helix bundle protein (predicted Tat secretion target)